MGADFRAIRHRRCLRFWTPSRTSTFNDHYLEVDYDLSNVMFTARPRIRRIFLAADGRMRSSGSPATPRTTEKVEIARKHLIPEHRHR